MGATEMNQKQRALVLADVRREIAAKEDELAKLSQVQDELAKLRQVEEFLVRRAVSPSRKSPTPSGEQNHMNPRAPSGQLTRKAGAEKVLRKAGIGHPMRTTEIAKALVEELGFEPLKGRDLEKRLYTVLSKSDLFAKAAKGAWTLKEFVKGKTKDQEGEKGVGK